jgi:hypothetical protein
MEVVFCSWHSSKKPHLSNSAGSTYGATESGLIGDKKTNVGMYFGNKLT